MPSNTRSAASILAPVWQGFLNLRQSTNNSRMAHVEGLRGLAMTLVFLGHFEVLFGHYLAPASASKAIYDFLAVWGHRGVAYFLVITGYFIYRHCLEQPAGGTSFARKRLLRILPLYWFVLCLYLALSVLFPSESKFPHDPAGAGLVILQNFLLMSEFVGSQSIMVVSWTISYLVVIYLSVPLVVNALGMSRRPRWQRVVLIFVAAAGWLVACRYNHHLSDRVVMMVVGMLVYEAMSAHAAAGKVLRRRGEIGAIGLLSLAMCLWYLANKHLLDFLPGSRFMEEYRYVFLGVGLFYFFSYFLSYRGLLQRRLSAGPLRRLGQMSYPYYLIHGVTLKGMALVADVLFRRTVYSATLFWLLLPACYLATLVACTCLHVYVEQPINQWLSSRRVRPAVVTRRRLLTPQAAAVGARREKLA